MNWLHIAALFSAITAFLHIVFGGKSAARPLLKSCLNDEAKYTNYYCWHMVSIILVAMAACFFLAAKSAEHLQLALLATVLAFCFFLWSVLLIIIKRQPVLVLPQWILFLPISVVGFIGIY